MWVIANPEDVASWQGETETHLYTDMSVCEARCRSTAALPGG